MATILDKDLTRETTVKVDDREIQITLTEGQTISMKLKGMKSGILEIPIEKLYHQLRGDGGGESVKEHNAVSIKHEEEDAIAQRIDHRPLQEAEPTHILDLLQLELKDLVGCGIQPLDLLLGEAEALDQLDVAKRFGRRTGQRRRLRDDRLLDLLDLATKYPAQITDHGHDRLSWLYFFNRILYSAI